MDMLGRALLLTGLVIALVGVLLMVGARVAFEGRLPGDLSLHWRGVHIYLPLASSLLVSLLLTALLSLLAAWRR